MAEPEDWHEVMAGLAEESLASDSAGPVITALYHGTCPCCGGKWKPGMAIAFYAPEDRYICGDCAR